MEIMTEQELSSIKGGGYWVYWEGEWHWIEEIR